MDVRENDLTWADWSIAELRAQSQIHRLVINPVIYDELSLTFSTVEALDASVGRFANPCGRDAQARAVFGGQAFVQYRRQGGTKTNVLADFFIGAHAAVAGLPVLTRDVRRWRMPNCSVGCRPHANAATPTAAQQALQRWGCIGSSAKRRLQPCPSVPHAPDSPLPVPQSWPPSCATIALNS